MRTSAFRARRWFSPARTPGRACAANYVGLLHCRYGPARSQPEHAVRTPPGIMVNRQRALANDRRTSSARRLLHPAIRHSSLDRGLGVRRSSRPAAQSRWGLPGPEDNDAFIRPARVHGTHAFRHAFRFALGYRRSLPDKLVREAFFGHLQPVQPAYGADSGSRIHGQTLLRRSRAEPRRT